MSEYRREGNYQEGNEYYREGDRNYREDVDIDIDTREQNTIADRGSVAAGDDIDDSAINTGRFAGIQNAGQGYVDAEGAVIGDDNITFQDSNVGAAAFGGDATNVQAAGNANLGSGTINDLDAGENLNFGSGTLTDVDAGYADQVIVGDENRVTGDVDVDVDDVSGNANLAIGDNNQQLATQDNDTIIDQSVTDNSQTSTFVDHSVTDSFNQQFDDSFNTQQEITTVTEDNDLWQDNDTWTDNSEYTREYTRTDVDTELDYVDDTDVEVDA